MEFLKSRSAYNIGRITKRFRDLSAAMLFLIMITGCAVNKPLSSQKTSAVNQYASKQIINDLLPLIKAEFPPIEKPFYILHSPTDNFGRELASQLRANGYEVFVNTPLNGNEQSEIIHTIDKTHSTKNYFRVQLQVTSKWKLNRLYHLTDSGEVTAISSVNIEGSNSLYRLNKILKKEALSVIDPSKSSNTKEIPNTRSPISTALPKSSETDKTLRVINGDIAKKLPSEGMLYSQPEFSSLWRVQLLSGKNLHDLLFHKKKLIKDGKLSHISLRKTMYSLRLGPFDTRTKAMKAAKEAQVSYKGAFIVKPTVPGK